MPSRSRTRKDLSPGHWQCCQWAILSCQPFQALLSFREPLHPRWLPFWRGPHSINHQLGISRSGHVDPTWDNSKGRELLWECQWLSSRLRKLEFSLCYPWFPPCPSTGTGAQSTPKYTQTSLLGSVSGAAAQETQPVKPAELRFSPQMCTDILAGTRPYAVPPLVVVGTLGWEHKDE